MLLGPWPIGGVPYLGVFLRDTSPYLHEFQEKHGKLRRQARLGFEPGTYRLPVLSVTTPPLAGRFTYKNQALKEMSVMGKFPTFIINPECC